MLFRSRHTMGRKKKGIGEDAVDSSAASTGAKGGKGMPMLLGAALVLAGGLGQRFVLANPPAEVIIAPPTEGVGSTGAGTSALDCSGYTKGYKDGTAPHARRAEGAAAAGGTSDLPSMTINLADGHYLKIGISLQLGATVVPAEFKANQARAADIVLNYFSTKSMDQLTNDKHGAIKSELTCLIEGGYAAERKEGSTATTVSGVLFREFLTS